MALDYETADWIGRVADRLNNLSYGAVIPLPDKVHKEQMAKIALELSNELKAICRKEGHDFWEGDEA